jgi:Pyruvate/2-oxoacid:ferredoxin oxidoreductase delta subunit
MGVTIIIANGAANAQAEALTETVASLCAGWQGARVVLMPHIYHLSGESDVWSALRDMPAPHVVVGWMHPRPTAAILRRHGMEIGEDAIVNLGAYQKPEAAAEAIRAAAGAALAGGEGSVETLTATAGTRWYPVVEDARCVHCRHCLQFCLFGVYAEVDGRVEVVNPDACKPGCPACSRICPHGAIMFPLYAKQDAIAGAPGQVMTPDLAARRMYYTRTKLPCTACGRPFNPQASASAGQPTCGECGMPLAPTAAAEPEGLDEVDALIDALDRIAPRGK